MEEIKNLICFPSIVASSLSYCYFFSSKIPIGFYRLFSLLPIFYLFTILPLSLSSAFATAVATFFITWLANFKLLLFAFGHAPLHPPKSIIVFIAVASLPVKIKSDSIKSKTKSPLNVWIEALIFPILVNFVYNYREILNPHVVLIIYCCFVFLLIDLLVAVSGAVIRTVVGVELEPPSDEPYLATSLQEFWGSRWNLMVTNILRHTVYKPVRSVFPGKKWGPLAAVMATFVVSGLMHELIIYYLTRVPPTWEMTAFFVFHGGCMVVELVAKRAFAGKWSLPAVVSRPLTVGFVVGTAFWLFFPPVIKSGADVKVLEEFKHAFFYVKDNIDRWIK